jgi:hypothetical protein
VIDPPVFECDSPPGLPTTGIGDAYAIKVAFLDSGKFQTLVLDFKPHIQASFGQVIKRE